MTDRQNIAAIDAMRQPVIGPPEEPERDPVVDVRAEH